MRYRGIPVEELAEKSTFKETAYLLINGRLPSEDELRNFSIMLNDHSLVHEDMKAFYQNFPRGSHPMGILSAMVNALRSFYPALHATEVKKCVPDPLYTRSVSLSEPVTNGFGVVVYERSNPPLREVQYIRFAGEQVENPFIPPVSCTEEGLQHGLCGESHLCCF